MDKQVNLANNPALNPEERARQLEGEQTSEESSRDYQRSTYLIDRDFQYRFATTWIASVLLYGVLTCLVSYWAVGMAEPSLQQGRITDVLLSVSGYVGVFVVLLTILFAIYFLLLSHRISGPAYRISESLERMADGDFNFTLQIRKSDYLHSIANGINSLLETLRNRDRTLAKIDRQVESLRTDLEEMDESEKQEEFVETCESIQEKVQTLRSPDRERSDTEPSSEE